MKKPNLTTDEDRLTFLFNGRVSDLTAVALHIGDIRGVEVPAALRARINVEALKWAREQMQMQLGSKK